MSARRVTIGLKPADVEPVPAGKPVDTGFDPDRAAKALDLLGAQAGGTGAERPGSPADAWLRRHDGREASSGLLAVPAADSAAAAWLLKDDERPSATIARIVPAPKPTNGWALREEDRTASHDSAPVEADEPAVVAEPLPTVLATRRLNGWSAGGDHHPAAVQAAAVVPVEEPVPVPREALGDIAGATQDVVTLPADVPVEEPHGDSVEATVLPAVWHEPALPAATSAQSDDADRGEPAPPAELEEPADGSAEAKVAPPVDLEPTLRTAMPGEVDDAGRAEPAPPTDRQELAAPAGETASLPAEVVAPAANEALAPAVTSAATATLSAIAGWMPHWRGVLLGAAVGAVVAALAVAFLAPRFAPSVDLRLAPIVDRVARLEAGAERTGREVGQLNNELAQTLDNGTAVAAQVAAQTASLAEIHQRLDEQAAQVAAEEMDPSVFAVAVAQLRAAFYAGRPFEAELINVYTMVRGDERFREPLQQLTAPARTGLPNVAEMSEQLRTLAASGGLVVGGSQTYYEYAASWVGQYIGYSSQPYVVEAANVALTDAERQLTEGDVTGAVEILGSLDPTLAAPLEPWLDTARAYLRAESAIDEMTKVVTDSLRRRMGVANAG